MNGLSLLDICPEAPPGVEAVVNGFISTMFGPAVAIVVVSIVALIFGRVGRIRRLTRAGATALVIVAALAIFAMGLTGKLDGILAFGCIPSPIGGSAANAAP